jgi:hypothetical protein
MPASGRNRGRRLGSRSSGGAGQAGGVAWGHQPSSRSQPRAERVPERSKGAVSKCAYGRAGPSS